MWQLRNENGIFFGADKSRLKYNCHPEVQSTVNGPKLLYHADADQQSQYAYSRFETRGRRKNEMKKINKMKPEGSSSSENV